MTGTKKVQISGPKGIFPPYIKVDWFLLDIGSDFNVLWRPAAATSMTSNGIQDCVFTISGICFCCAGAGGCSMSLQDSY